MYNSQQRICAEQPINELTLNLLSRSYPKQLITDAIEKAKGHSRADLLSPRQDNSKQDVIPFIHTHNPRNIDVTLLISEINQILQNDRRAKDIYNKKMQHSCCVTYSIALSNDISSKIQLFW